MFTTPGDGTAYHVNMRNIVQIQFVNQKMGWSDYRILLLFSGCCKFGDVTKGIKWMSLLRSLSLYLFKKSFAFSMSFNGSGVTG